MDFQNWFSTLETFQKGYWAIAIIASLFFIITLISTFVFGGGDDIGDVDAEIEGDTGAGFQFFTFKNLVAFFTIFGWTGIACIDGGVSNTLSVVISLACGLVMMFIMASLFYYMGKLNDSGTLKLKNALNAIGEVYLTIGAKRSTIGKVHVRIQGALRELEALTDSEEEIKSGTAIMVKEVTPNGILIVEPLN